MNPGREPQEIACQPSWEPAGPWHAEMLYYNKDRKREPMTEHRHHHPHGHAHPPAAIGPSILRLSVLQRLVFAAVLTALVWAAVIWAMRT